MPETDECLALVIQLLSSNFGNTSGIAMAVYFIDLFAAVDVLKMFLCLTTVMSIYSENL